jgi:N-acetylmuramoyl-L-alanine amidase
VKRWRHSRILPAVSAALSGLLLAGCAGKTYSPLAPSEPARTVSAASSAAATPTTPEVVAVTTEAAPVIGLDHIHSEPVPTVRATNTAPPPKPRITFGRGWVPLAVWTQRLGLGAPEPVAAGGTSAYRVATRAGWAKLTVGTRLAQWNGAALWLGFAPVLIRGEPHIHGLDAEKTLLPLTEPAEHFALPRRVIVLDPGHGGADAGTRDAQLRSEKDFALDWALRTERHLTNAGWKVFLTRRTDVDVSLADRVLFADRVQADLFISLHFNSTAPQTQAAGIETYCLTPTGMTSTLARGFADDERAVFPNNAFDAANTAWAFRLHRSLVATTQARDDGVKRARFMSVLRYQNRPAVLIEGGFLSNVAEAANISSPEYRELLARALAEGLKGTGGQ